MRWHIVLILPLRMVRTGGVPFKYSLAPYPRVLFRCTPFNNYAVGDYIYI